MNEIDAVIENVISEIPDEIITPIDIQVEVKNKPKRIRIEYELNTNLEDISKKVENAD
jgi:hypothetical protein